MSFLSFWSRLLISNFRYCLLVSIMDPLKFFKQNILASPNWNFEIDHGQSLRNRHDKWKIFHDLCWYNFISFGYRAKKKFKKNQKCFILHDDFSWHLVILLTFDHSVIKFCVLTWLIMTQWSWHITIQSGETGSSKMIISSCTFKISSMDAS